MANAVTRLLVLTLTLTLGGVAVRPCVAYGQGQSEIKRAVRAEPIPDLKPTLPTPQVHDILISPHTPMRMYAATPSGLYLSDDVGVSWKPLPVAGDYNEVFTLAVHPTDPSIMVVGRRYGLWVTHDGGRSWIPLPYPAGKPIIPLAIAVAPNQPQMMYMATARDGLYKSVDGSSRWEPINQGLPESRAGGRVEEIRTLIVHPLDANTAYVVLKTHGIYLTTDAGASWRPFNEGLPFPFLSANYPPILEFDLTDPKRLYLVFGQRIHSHLVRNRMYVTSGTAKWTPVEVELPSNVAVLALGIDRVRRTVRLWSPSTAWQVPLTEDAK